MKVSQHLTPSGVFCYSKYMSTTSYKRNTRVYYKIAWSIDIKGERKWKVRQSFSSTPETAYEETKDSILYSNYPTFKMKLVGYRIE